MRILLLTSSSNASGGGRQALYLASGMRERGHSVSFFAPAKSMLRPLAPDLDWRELPEKRSRWRQAIESALPPDAPAIVHAFHNKAVKTLAWCGTLWRMLGKPVACVAHRGVIYRPNNILPYIVPGIRIFAVNSRACLETLPIFWRRNTGRVVYNCVPESKITPGRPAETVRADLGIKPDDIVVGCVGNSSPIKGFDVLIRAFAAIVRPGRVLCIVGAERETWLPLCEKLGIAASVRLVPRTEAVADYMQLYSLFVLPSLSESSPNTLLEAMCMGLPAVCSKVGGVAECIDDPRCLVPPGNAAALASAMNALLDEPVALAAVAERNRAFSRRFSVAEKMAVMEEIYTDLLRPYQTCI